MDWSSFVGLPWRDRGRSADGYDCWGLLRDAFEAGTGIALPSHDGRYHTAADREETEAILADERSAWAQVSEQDVRPFDVVVLRIAGSAHVGLMVRRGSMLHIPYRGTSVIEPVGRRGVLDGFYRHNQVDLGRTNSSIDGATDHAPRSGAVVGDPPASPAHRKTDA